MNAWSDCNGFVPLPQNPLWLNFCLNTFLDSAVGPQDNSHGVAIRPSIAQPACGITREFTPAASKEDCTMPFCSGCGNEVANEVAFCPKCGAPTGAAGAVSPAAAPSASAAPAGLEENVAGLLCYVLGWLTGLIFLLIDKRPFVRFHAMQSLVTFGALHVVNLVLVFGGVMGGFAGGMMGGFMLGGISWLVYGLISILILVLWIVCMVKAFQGQRFKVPIAGNIAENYAK